MNTLYKRKGMELELGFTKIYRENQKESKAIKEARCLSYQIPRILLDIQEDDLFPGGCHYGAVGFSSQIGGFLYYCHEEKIQEEIRRCRDEKEYVKKLEEMLNFWRKENSRDRLRGTYSFRQNLALPTDDWEQEKAVAYPLYRIAGAILDFRKLLTEGLPGLEAEVNNRRKEETDPEKKAFYQACAISLETLKRVIRLYEKRACELAEQSQDPEVIKRMRLMEGAMQRIRQKKPEHLLEAAELFWMYVIVSEVRNYGRIDDYLGEFYAADIDAGYLREEEADWIVKKLWERMGKRRTITDGRVMIGGRGRKNEAAADRMAKACIRATRTLKNPDPQLSLRFYKGMDPELMELSLQAIGEGCTYPVLYNDDVIIRDVQEAFEVSEKEAVSYVPYGCGEYILDHRSFGTPSGVLNLLKGLEIFMNFTRSQDAEYLSGTKGMETEKALRKEAGIEKSFLEYETFEAFYEAYKRFIEFHIEVLAEQEKLEYDFTGEICSLPYLSMLYDDCLERGKSVFGGGIQYLGGTMESYGNVNTSDSLYALKELVFDKKEIDRQDLLNALDADFAGFEGLRRRLKNCEKFGNDREKADEMARDLHRFVCLTAKKQAQRVGLDSYLAVIINNSANTSLGLLTKASPDGRRSGKPMANANSPQADADQNGVTAVMNSMLKMDTRIHAGSVQNIKFSKETYFKNADAVRQILDGYFGQGGAQLMITVVGKEDLEAALKTPENYSNLLVRVGGFSAKFVELSREVQEDILSRTCY